MTIMLVLIYMVLTAVFEVILLMNSYLVRRWLTDILTVLLAFGVGALMYVRLDIITVIIGLLTLYRIVNIERLTHRTLQDDYVNHLARRASLVLIISQLFLGSLLGAQEFFNMTTNNWLLGVSLLDLFAAGIFAHTLDRQVRVTSAPKIMASRDEHDLPTLTVAIPARNETSDLEACLQTLVSSRYLKLEILVLDDCSQNQRTPEIIRQFAHDGVRFIAGSAPPDNWLAKNHAYQQLLEEANGDLILFCGVDSRFEPNSLTAIVETLLDRQKTMLSIMPRNHIPSRFKLEALLVQPGRYAWELVLPRRWLDRPPVLSCCWLVQKQLLMDSGGLAAVSRAVQPERYFARYAALHQDGYSFLQSGEQLGLSSAKSFDDQRATAVRTRYPSLHRRVELTALVSLIELVLLVVPYINLVYCLASQRWLLAIINIGCCTLLSYVYSQVVCVTYQRRLLRGLWLFPFAAAYDICLLNYSTWQYEFSEVIWKGRNVCIPVMRIVPNLPTLHQINAIHPRGRHHRHRYHSRHNSRHSS